MRRSTALPHAAAMMAALGAIGYAGLAARPAGATAARLVAQDTGGVITVHTADWPAAGWELVFDDARNGTITQFRIASAADGTNLCAEGSSGLPAGFFEKVWGTARGPHWLSGAFGGTSGASALVEANELRARVVEEVLATDAAPGERPAEIRVAYTILHTGRMYIETRWQLNDLGVSGAGLYDDNSWRMVLANRDGTTGATDEHAHASLVGNDIAGLPALVFSAYPTFWQNGAARSIDDTDTRLAWCGPRVFGITSDPFSGLAGARYAGSDGLANPYAAGTDLRHVFLIDWSQPAPRPIDVQVASRAGLEFAYPDPLTGAAGAGWIEQGSSDRGDAADGDHDGFAESEGCHVAGSDGNDLLVVLPPGRSTPSGDPLPLGDLFFRIKGMYSARDSLPLMSSIDGGVSWELLVPGVDYLATTRADEVTLGAGVRLLSVFRQFPVDAAVDVRLAYGDLAGLGLVVSTELRGPVVESRPGEVVISWSASRARSYAGYHVSRMDLAGPEWRRLTSTPVTTAGGAGAGQDPAGVASFRWVDRTAVPGHWYRYRVEAIPVSGRAPLVITAAEAVLASAGDGGGGGAGGGPGDPAGDAGADRPALRAWPNPCNPVVNFAIDIGSGGVAGDGPAAAADRARLDIVDANGRLVRAIWRDDPSGTRTRRSVAWDGADDHGRAVPSGVYFAQLRAGARVITRKIVLLK